MSDCIFCDIIEGHCPASIVYSDEAVVAFMDIQPVNKGHVLVVPRLHSTNLAELDEEEAAACMVVVKKIAAAIRSTSLPCEGVNIFLADGEAAGQEVFHVHFHVFPRYANDGFGLRFSDEYTKLPPRTELDEVAAKIKDALTS